MQRVLLVFCGLLMLSLLASCSALQMRATELTVQTQELETLLSEMPWVSERMSIDRPDIKPVYQFSFRTCPPCISFKTEGWPVLEAAGLEPRLIMTARRSKSTADERTAVVELARTRDWDMAKAWMAANSPKGYYRKMTFTAADGNAAREAELEKLRTQIDSLDDILAANNVDMAYPTILWQDSNGAWHAEVGYHNLTARNIIASMGGT